MNDLEHFGTPCSEPVDPITGYCEHCEEGFTGEPFHCECGAVVCQYCLVQCEECEVHNCKDCMVQDKEGNYFCNSSGILENSDCYIEWNKEN